MKCPLLLTKFPKDIMASDCAEEECGWWAKDQKCCAVLGAYYVMDSIDSTLNNIDTSVTSMR